jgi:hypothetical protein
MAQIILRVLYYVYRVFKLRRSGEFELHIKDPTVPFDGISFYERDGDAFHLYFGDGNVWWTDAWRAESGEVEPKEHATLREALREFNRITSL